MKTRYEEKSFENYFNNELDSKSKIYFPFGQIQEGILGFDSSAYSKNRYLWKKLGFPFFLKVAFYGAKLKEVAEEMERYLDLELNGCPQINTNIIFQYKRPDYINGIHSAEWYYWKQPYFRYEIDLNQHELLKHIDLKFGNAVLVLYAAPAIKDINELVDFKISKKIIDNTNFCKVSKLNNHNKNTYIKSGQFSVAFSEPEEITNFNLLESISNSKENKESNSKIVLDFSNKIINIMNEDKYIGNSFRKMTKEYEEINEFQLVYNHVCMQIFKELTGAQWVISINKS
jgi:hypothetical protein